MKQFLEIAKIVATQGIRGEVRCQYYCDTPEVLCECDMYFIQDIIGLTVKDADTGEVYGKISEVYQNGAADVYSIKKENGVELMFPCIDEVVKKVDIAGGEMLIKPLPGLFDDEDGQ